MRLFNDVRIAYVRGEVGEEWMEMLRRDRLVVAAREVHVLYESEGLPDEEFVGAMRYVRREGKAAVLEQRLVEAATGRAVARAWVVQLLVSRRQGGRLARRLLHPGRRDRRPRDTRRSAPARVRLGPAGVVRRRAR